MLIVYKNTITGKEMIAIAPTEEKCKVIVDKYYRNHNIAGTAEAVKFGDVIGNYAEGVAYNIKTYSKEKSSEK